MNQFVRIMEKREIEKAKSGNNAAFGFGSSFGEFAVDDDRSFAAPPSKKDKSLEAEVKEVLAAPMEVQVITNKKREELVDNCAISKFEAF